jgi:hypothetical protein
MDSSFGRRFPPQLLIRQTSNGYWNLQRDFLHLALTADLAIRLRLVAESFSALALPPFRPPSRPNATAAGFFSGFG